MAEDNMENDTPETVDDTQESTPETESNEELTKAKEVAENQKIRAEKAEAKLKKIEEASSEPETETPTKQEEKQSDEPDYAKLAFLEGKGIQHPDDQKIIQDEAARLKLPLTDVLEMEHIKGQLKDSKDQREAEAGMPDSSGKSTGTNKSSVDHWVNKKNKDGTYNTPEDLELATKVIQARVKQENNASKFSETLYTK